MNTEERGGRLRCLLCFFCIEIYKLSYLKNGQDYYYFLNHKLAFSNKKRPTIGYFDPVHEVLGLPAIWMQHLATNVLQI